MYRIPEPRVLSMDTWHVVMASVDQHGRILVAVDGKTVAEGKAKGKYNAEFKRHQNWIGCWHREDNSMPLTSELSHVWVWPEALQPEQVGHAVFAALEMRDQGRTGELIQADEPILPDYVKRVWPKPPPLHDSLQLWLDARFSAEGVVKDEADSGLAFVDSLTNGPLVPTVVAGKVCWDIKEALKPVSGSEVKVSKHPACRSGRDAYVFYLAQCVATLRIELLLPV